MELLFKISPILIFVFFVALVSAVFGWFSEASKKVNEDEFNRKLREKLEDEKSKYEDDKYEFELEMVREKNKLEEVYSRKKNALEQLINNQIIEIDKSREYLDKRDIKFKEGYLAGRNWLAEYIAESEGAIDELLAYKLNSKKHPARKAAKAVSDIQAEKRRYKEELTFLKYQLKSYVEYFPILEEYQNTILDEAIDLQADNNIEELESTDPVLKYIPYSEYQKLPTSIRNQRALDNFLNKNHSQAEIGKFYERYLGFLYEADGWNVEYHGILEGRMDLGRDLQCKKGNEYLIIQAKCWSIQKTIHEKHIFQLFGTLKLFEMKLNEDTPSLFKPEIKAIFITTTELSDVARKAAEILHIEVKERFELNKSYPIIKCNINQQTQEKIYHLPFDQQYDKTKIIPEYGECYVNTVEKAESLGFRRAFRFKGNNN